MAFHQCLGLAQFLEVEEAGLANIRAHIEAGEAIDRAAAQGIADIIWKDAEWNLHGEKTEKTEIHLGPGFEKLSPSLVSLLSLCCSSYCWVLG